MNRRIRPSEGRAILGNGSPPKSVATVNGPIEIKVPRDRNESFQPAIVTKRPAGSTTPIPRCGLCIRTA
ncbi:transposase [Mycobacterium riyadhense]|nr:transposase [Mycobacterium riyadhense]